MKSNSPPDDPTASFDDLWDAFDDPPPAAAKAGPLPLTMGPRAAPNPAPPPAAPTVRPDASDEEDRPTALPPLPAEKFAQTLMALSELDAPPSMPTPDHDVLLQHAVPAAPKPAPRPAAVPGRDAKTAPAKLPRPNPPAAPPAAGGASSLPIPRAPSIPPPGTGNPLDAFDALDALPFEPIAPSSPVTGSPAHPRAAPNPAPPLAAPRTPTPFPAIRGPLGAPRTPSPFPAMRDAKPAPFTAAPRTPSPFPAVDDPAIGRMTPPLLRSDLAFANNPPPQPKRTSSSAGLRLGKPAARAPAVAQFEAQSVSDRVTPVGDGEAFDLGFAEIPAPPQSDRGPSSTLDRAREMTSLFEAKNYVKALVLAESVLAADPKHEAARRCAEGCREALAEKYLARLGGREGRPRVVMSPAEMHALSLDHRAGFLLSSIDGGVTVEEVLDVCSMPALDALRILFELKEQGVIEISEPPKRGRR